MPVICTMCIFVRPSLYRVHNMHTCMCVQETNQPSDNISIPGLLLRIPIWPGRAAVTRTRDLSRKSWNPGRVSWLSRFRGIVALAGMTGVFWRVPVLGRRARVRIPGSPGWELPGWLHRRACVCHMYVCVCVCVYVCVCMFVCVYIYIYIYMGQYQEI
jgi:hypothetical protein